MHQRAVLAGGCFWGMQDLILAARHHLDPCGLHGDIRTPRIVITARMPRDRDCLRPDSDELPEHPGILPDPRSDDAEPPGQ